MLPHLISRPHAPQQSFTPSLHGRHTSTSYPSPHIHPNHLSSFHGVKLPKLQLSFSRKPRSSCAPPVLALAKKQQQPTFYELLELSQDVELSDIKQAYRRLARKYHPDVCSLEESTRRFIEIQEAYETLSNPRRRAVYDCAIVNGLATGIGGRRCYGDAEVQQNGWRSQWEDQLSGLKRRGAVKADRGESWAARVRRQRERSGDAS